jgi:Uma2 family endonuclease
MSTVALPRFIEAEQYLLLSRLTWQQYLAISNALPDGCGLRTAFDGENFELMVTTFGHEWFKKLIGRLIEMLSLELGIDIRSGGQTTFRSEHIQRGLEADQCYWVAHAAAMANKLAWHADIDPPPDLAIEIDVTSSSIDREAIYALLKVPELWRFDGDVLQAYRLTRNGRYRPIEYSLAFPFLRVAELLPFLLSGEESETTLIRTFVEWVRHQDFPCH